MTAGGFRRFVELVSSTMPGCTVSEATGERLRYAERLHERRMEAQRPRRANARLGKWQPRDNWCHENATTWAAYASGFKAVRGWRVIRYEDGGPPYTAYMAHSVVENEAGELVDITPQHGSFDPPFLRAEDVAEFEALLDAGVQSFYRHDDGELLVVSVAGHAQT